MPQLINTIETRPNLENLLHSENFKCPYQANVINTLESTKSPIVVKDFMVQKYDFEKAVTSVIFALFKTNTERTEVYEA